MKLYSVFVPLALVGLLAACDDKSTTLPANTARETFYVAQNKSFCYSFSPDRSCLMTKVNLSDKWLLFYGSIQGFDYQPGYRYKVQVLATKVTNPPADAPDTEYKLEKVLEKVADSSTAVVNQ